MKKSSFLLRLLVVTLSFLTITFGGSVKASTVKTQSEKSKPWVAAYKKIIKEIDKEYSTTESKVTYDLIYFNKDKTPELVAGISGYWVSMYTYDDGKVYTVMDQWGYGAMGNTGYQYLPKKNILLNYNSDFAGASLYTYYGKMKNHEIVNYYPKELRMDCFIDKNKNGFPDEEELLEDQWVYYYGNKKISEKKYNTYLLDGTYKDIIGTMSKKKILKKLK